MATFVIVHGAFGGVAAGHHPGRSSWR